MNYVHSALASGKWFTLALMEQLGHVGSEVDRAIYWLEKNDKELSLKAVDRALELLDLIIIDPRWRRRLKEILRTREVLCDRFYGENEYHTDSESLKKYFLCFAWAARKNR